MAERRGQNGRWAVRAMPAVGVAAALALTLTGCTGSPGPAATTPGRSGPTTASASPSEPSIAAPERPAAMDRDDAEGAIAAATYFISLYSYVYATGDLDQWQAISDPECVFCAGLSTDIQAASAMGTTFRGGELKVTSTSATSGDAPDFFRVDLTVSQASFESIDSSGAVSSASPGTASATMTTVLEHRTQGWLVRAATSNVTQK